MRRLQILFFAPGLWAASWDMATASTVIPMDATRMADEAGQVILGEVATVRSDWAENPRRIETVVEFHDVTYAKNPLPDAPARFTMVVPGGTVGTWSMRVCGGPAFRPGERWLLFLLPEYRTYPVVGVSQGAFRIVHDADGVSRVLDSGGRAVLGLDQGRFVETAPGDCDAQGQDSRAPRPVASVGARVLEDGSRTADMQAISLEAFLGELQPLLDASQRHEMSQPAGRRIPVTYRPVPLRGSGHTGQGDSSKGLRTGGDPNASVQAVSGVQPGGRRR